MHASMVARRQLAHTLSDPMTHTTLRWSPNDDPKIVGLADLVSAVQAVGYDTLQE